MAATSVLKLVLDDKEYSASIKEARKGMVDLERALHDAGKSFSDVDKSVLAYAKEIGNMNTVAKESKGQLREMSQTLTELTRVYRQLSDEEKSSEFGKGLLDSINKLTERAGEIQDAMGDVQASIQNAASDTRLFDQMTQGAQVLTAGFQGLTGAGKLLGINMGDNVEVIAKLQAAMGVMNSLTTIQNALQKQSALMMGLSAIKAKLLSGELTAASVAAKALNVALKGLGIGLAIAAITTLIDKLGLFSSESDSASDATDRFNDSLQKMDNKVKDLETSFQNLISYMQQIGSSSEVIDDLRKQAADEEVSLAVAEYRKLFDKGASGVFGRVLTSINQSVIPQDVQQKALEKVNAARDRQAKVYQEIANKQKQGDFFNSNWNTLTTEKQINAAIGYFRNLRSELEKGSTEYAEMTRRIEILQSKITTGSQGRVNRSGTKTSTPIVEKIQTEVTSSLTELQILQDALNTVENSMSPYGKASDEWKEMNEYAESLRQKIKELNGELDELPETTTEEVVGQKVIASQALGSLAGGVSQIAGGIEQLGIDIPEGFNKAIGIMQAVAAILTGINAVVTIIAAIQGAKAIPIIGWLAARGGVVKAAEGYTVPGNNYSNDMVPALLNSGELVLNKAQQGNLASQLSTPQGGYAAQPYVNGEMILLGTNNYLGRSGQGEVVTTKMLKSMGLMK